MERNGYQDLSGIIMIELILKVMSLSLSNYIRTSNGLLAPDPACETPSLLLEGLIVAVDLVSFHFEPVVRKDKLLSRSLNKLELSCLINASYEV